MSTPFGYYIASQLPAPAYGVSLRRMDLGVPDVQPGEVAFAAYPTNDQLTAAGFVLTKTQLKSLYALGTAIAALTTAQQNNIWADLFGGTPPKYQSDVGPNAAAIGAVYLCTTTPGVFTAPQKIGIAAFYVQDNPGYLIQPSFDPTINISGYA